MKNFLALLAIGLTTAAMAQGTACDAAASAKKLTGAAKTAFLKQCAVDTRLKIDTASSKSIALSQEKKSPLMSRAESGMHCDHGSDL